MTTYATMQTRIADEMVRDDLSTYIASAILDAIKQWEAVRFFFNEKRYQILTVASQEYYDITGSPLLTSAGAATETGEKILEIDGITCLISAGQIPYALSPRSQRWFDENQGGTSNLGMPASYGTFGDQLRIYPIPRTVYTLNIQCLARLKTLSAGTDTNSWMTDGEVLIRNQAKTILYRDIVRDADGMAAAKDALTEAEWNLINKTTGATMTGRQAPWTL